MVSCLVCRLSILVGVEVIWVKVCGRVILVVFVYFRVSGNSILSLVVFGLVLLKGRSLLLVLIGVWLE